MKGLVLMLILFSLSVTAQNLVQNFSFEDTINCSNFINWGGPEAAAPWFTPTLGSTDFFSSFGGFRCWYGGVPSNPVGYQPARTGKCYIGFGIYDQPPYINSREYVTGVLSDSLKKNHTYCCEMYVSAANFGKYVTDDLGMLFTKDSVYNYTNHFELPYTPQIVNTPGQILNDTLNWMKVSGSFVAQGGERFITIGNFKDDAHTTLDTIAGAIYWFGYYYLDDVSVTDCTAPVNEIKEPEITLSPNPAGDYLQFNFENYRQQEARIVITNVPGQKVMERSYTADEMPHEMNIRGFAAGVYFVTFEQEGVRLVRKFVKR